jgi:tetratricopeptide (TPR) repeat protein
MQKKPWAIYVWPGLPHIWMRGSWAALGVAVIAAALLVLAILGSSGWSELIDSGLRRLLWISLAVIWCSAGVVSAIKLRHHDSLEQPGSCEDLFAGALNLYLEGDYFQAEGLLNKLLKKDVRDLDARLLLATLLRHTGRIEQASKQLDELLSFDGAEKWEVEIRNEQDLLRQAKTKLNDRHSSGIAIAPTIHLDDSMPAA